MGNHQFNITSHSQFHCVVINMLHHDKYDIIILNINCNIKFCISGKLVSGNFLRM